MAREPKFVFKDFVFNASLNKVDRDKVYGWSEIRYTDVGGKPCSFISMLEDGKTMIGTGGLSFKTVDSHYNEIDKSSLIAKNADGTPAALLSSVFDSDNQLSADKSISDYMAMDVKSVYQLGNISALHELSALLTEHKVLYFNFNYRSGYEADDAFLIAQGNAIFAVIGKITDFQFATLSVPLSLVEEGEDSGDDLDFNML